MVVLGGISAVAFLFHKTATNHHSNSIVETEKKITTDSKVGTLYTNDKYKFFSYRNPTFLSKLARFIEN